MSNVFWGIILILLGGLFLLDNMDVVDFGDAVRTYWPLLLVLWGISILLKKKELHRIQTSSGAKQSVTSELFHESSIFGDLSVGIESNNFKGGSISTVFGDGHIDLSKARIAEGEHWLRVSGVFGDVTITLPKDLATSITGTVLLGDIQIFHEKRSGFSTDLQYVVPGYDSAQRKLRLSISYVIGEVRVS